MITSGRRVAVAGWIGSSNLGDELIFKALRRQIEERGVPTVALSIDPDATAARHGCEVIPHRGPRDSLTLYKALGGASAMVFGGGGLLQSETSRLNLPFHLSRVWSARLRHVPWAGLGLGVGDLGGRLEQWLVRRTLASAVGITVRDQGSSAILRSIGVSEPVVAADPVIGFSVPECGPRDVIAVSLRQMNTGGFGTASARAGNMVDDDWLACMARALDALAVDSGFGVRFVALQPDRDGPLHAAVAERMALPTSMVEASVDTVLDEISASRYVVAMRYHAAIIALVASRPCVVLDYSPKMRYLVDDVGDGMAILPPERIEAGDLVNAMRRADKGASMLEPTLARLRDRERLNGRLLDRLLESA